MVRNYTPKHPPTVMPDGTLKYRGRPKGKRDSGPRKQRVEQNPWRNERGLTPKMMEALPILCRELVPSHGIAKIIEKGLVGEAHYWKVWNRDPHWIREVNRERERLHGAVRQRAQAVAVMKVEKAIETISDIAEGKITAKSNQLQACIELCRIAGVERVVDTGPKFNVFGLIGQQIKSQSSTGEIRQFAIGGELVEEQVETELEDEIDMENDLDPGEDYPESETDETVSEEGATG